MRWAYLVCPIWPTSIEWNLCRGPMSQNTWFSMILTCEYGLYSRLVLALVIVFSWRGVPCVIPHLADFRRSYYHVRFGVDHLSWVIFGWDVLATGDFLGESDVWLSQILSLKTIFLLKYQLLMSTEGSHFVQCVVMHRIAKDKVCGMCLVSTIGQFVPSRQNA